MTRDIGDRVLEGMRDVQQPRRCDMGACVEPSSFSVIQNVRDSLNQAALSMSKARSPLAAVLPAVLQAPVET